MKNTIMTAINLSCLSYLDISEIRKGLSGKFTNVHWIDNHETDTQVLICEDEKNVWVVFRGTEFDNMNDWITNLDCSFTQALWGQVHAGFYKDVKSVKWKIVELIYDAMKTKQVIFTGHSQGAADAELMFSEMCYYLPQQEQICIPIETPRNMSKDTAEAFGDLHGWQIFHVVNNNDVVTRVPIRLMGYAHVKNINLNYLDENGLLHHSMTWWEMFKDRVKGRLYDFGELGTDGIKDHSIKEVQRIWKNLL